MPRKNLIRTNLFPYHVTIRSNNREWFSLPLKEVWNICLDSLIIANEKYPVKLQAFVLMSNHYHMMIWTPDCNLDKFMFEFNRTISKVIRIKTQRINRIFGDRYKWSIIRDQKYFLQVEKYIYQNPLKVNLVSRCEDYQFSTLHYITKNKRFSIELYRNTITKNELDFINNTSEYYSRDQLTKSLSKPKFKPPRKISSRRIIN